MIFKEKTITLNNGQKAILKSPSVDNAAEMLQYIKTACTETDYLVREAEEWDDVTLESEENWISNNLKSDSILMITCYIDGKIAGNCEISFRSDMKTRHRATIGIAILKDYWNLGIGSAMFYELIEAAKEHGTEILELEFFEGNERGRHLYEKFGFKIVCEKPNAFKLKDGRMISEIHMQKDLR